MEILLAWDPGYHNESVAVNKIYNMMIHRYHLMNILVSILYRDSHANKYHKHLIYEYRINSLGGRKVQFIS